MVILISAALLLYDEGGVTGRGLPSPRGGGAQPAAGQRGKLFPWPSVELTSGFHEARAGAPAARSASKRHPTRARKRQHAPLGARQDGVRVVERVGGAEPVACARPLAHRRRHAVLDVEPCLPGGPEGCAAPPCLPSVNNDDDDSAGAVESSSSAVTLLWRPKRWPSLISRPKEELCDGGTDIDLMPIRCSQALAASR